MYILLRISLFTAFAAAGVGVAVPVALHRSPVSDGSQGIRAGRGAIDLHEQRSRVPRPLSPFLAAVATSAERPSESHIAQPVAQESGINSKLDRLEMKLEVMQEAARRDQMARLESKLHEMELAARDRQRLWEQSAHEQQRHVEQAARQQQELIMTLAQAVTDSAQQSAGHAGPPVIADSTAQPSAPAASTKPIDIHRGEGDDMLTLNLRDDDLRTVLEFLSAEGNLNILAMESVQGKVTASLSKVDVRTALAAILKSTRYIARYEGDFVYVGRPEDFQQMDQLADQVTTRIYRTNYVTAAELQKLITPLLTPSVGMVTLSTPSQVDIPVDSTKTGGDDFAGNEVMMVRDYEAVLAKMDEIVAVVDTRPRQVVIEAMILSVNLDDTHKHGVDFDFLRRQGTLKFATGAPLANLGSIDVTSGGLHFGFLDSDLGTFIEALETVGDTDVIASPHLLCLNKQRAEILIGDQKGYLSTTQTETATTQTVEFLDVGTQLRIRPFISADGLIRLEVHPELSTGDVKLVGTFALPEKSTTQVTTNIMCRDGSTIVIGGLIRDDMSNSFSQVPFLGSIPVVGKVFRKRTEFVTRNEIIVLITPRIIHDPGEQHDGCWSQTELARRQAPLHDPTMSQMTRQRYAERYLHMAKNAWRAGSATTALEYVDLALYFVPNHVEACSLRHEILGDASLIEPTLGFLPDASVDQTTEPFFIKNSIETVQLPPRRKLFDPPPLTATPSTYPSTSALDDPPLPRPLEFLAPSGP